jgi:hypothetical protein
LGRLGPNVDHKRLWAETLSLPTTYLHRFGSPRAFIWIWGPCFLLQMAGPSLRAGGRVKGRVARASGAEGTVLRPFPRLLIMIGGTTSATQTYSWLSHGRMRGLLEAASRSERVRLPCWRVASRVSTVRPLPG